MNKSELIETLSTDLSLSISTASSIVDIILKAITEELVKEGNVEIRGFGSFTVRHYQPFEGRNPKTGEVTKVKPKKLPFFKVGRELKFAVDARPESKP